MKNLWTPWRTSYISGQAGKREGCIFDELAGRSAPDKETLTLYRDKLVVVLLNGFPYANGHLLIGPSRHLADVAELSDEESTAIMEMIRASVAILRKHLKPDGLNVGLNLGAVAGAGISDHLHFHVVPRWEGDHNFMTVLAEVRTIPEHIDNTFDMLLPDFVILANGK